MSFLKKPLVAFLICVIVVCASSVISVHAKLDRKCEAITENFSAAGGIADQLGTVCTAGSGIVQLAESYGLETAEADLDKLSAELKAAQSAISTDSYNSLVSGFLRDKLGSFGTGVARLCGVELPEKFA